MNIAWWVQRWSELHPDRPAIFHENRVITYLDLHQRANQTGCWLQSLGIQKGDRVAVMLANSLEFIEIYLACARLGAMFVPLNYRLTGPELRYTVQNAQPKLLVFGADHTAIIQGLPIQEIRPFMAWACAGRPSAFVEALDYQAGVEAFSGQRVLLDPSLEPSNPEEPQVIMYTSGTTGHPKGAVLSHRKTFFNCLNADIFFKLHFDDIMLVVLPLFHSGALFIQTSPILYKGAAMVLHRRFEPARVYEDLERFRVTKFLAVPTIYRSLLKEMPQKKPDLSSLQVCAIGGERTTHDLLMRCRDAGFSLRQIMGQTETSILLWASEEASLLKPGTVGRPVFHAEVALMDSDGRPVQPGQIGEIVVRGSIMMKEYWQDPVKTRETIRKGWLHTGDLAFMDEDGYFYLVDRARDLYISGGENVYPAEVERVLREHPAIEDVAIIGVPDDVWGEVGHAFVVQEPGTCLEARDILSFCQGRLARFKWPKSITLCQDLPRTSLGKIRKGEIQRQWVLRD